MKVNVEFQEPDKKKKIKRIIAREGLILLGFIALFIFSTYTQGNFVLYALLGYPAYLLIRFILWAVKTLKEK